MGALHMPTAAGHHPLKSYSRMRHRHMIILKSVTFTMTTDSPPRAPPRDWVFVRECPGRERDAMCILSRLFVL